MGMEDFGIKPPQDSPEESVEAVQSFKKMGIGFVESIKLMNGRLGKMDKDLEVVSPNIIGRLRSAAQRLEESFQGSELNLEEIIMDVNKIASSLDNLSLINDRDFVKIAEDSRRVLVGSIEGVKDSAIALRMTEQAVELRRSLNGMINKADEAAFRFRRGAR